MRGAGEVDLGVGVGGKEEGSSTNRQELSQLSDQQPQNQTAELTPRLKLRPKLLANTRKPHLFGKLLSHKTLPRWRPRHPDPCQSRLMYLWDVMDVHAETRVHV